MMAVILWKEYRQQRSTWIAVTILAVLLSESLLATAGPGTLRLLNAGSIQSVPAIVLVGAVIAYGIICGAQLLGTEKEEGTLEFLDNLTGQRGKLWRCKLCAGALLTFFQSLIIARYFVSRHIGDWPLATLFPPLAMVAFTWGLLGGAICRHVLTATLTATAFMAASFALFYPLSTQPWLIIPTELGASLAAAVIARQLFCQDDRQRARAATRRANTAPLPYFSSWQAIFWLVYRQGRWVLVGVGAAAIALAFTTNLLPFVIWPVGTLLLGLACGLAVFSPDQQSGRLFWGAQGFSQGRIWYLKLFAWTTILVGLLACTWIAIAAQAKLDTTSQGAANAASAASSFSPVTALSVWQGPSVEPERSLDPYLFLILWPVYGFSIGVFLGQVTRRPVIALILSILIAPAATALWVPSFLIGGLPVWQVLIVPGMLLLTSRLIQRAWISDRLWSPRPIAGISAAASLMGCCLAGYLWYRSIEVPDVGAPFNIPAFISTLPIPERKADPFYALITQLEDHIKAFDKSSATDNQLGPQQIIRNFLEDQVWLEQHPEFGKWVDALFENAEFKENLRQVASTPFGMVKNGSNEPIVRSAPDTKYLARVVQIRAHQLEARGDLKGALSLFGMVLGIARQLENNAPLQTYGKGVHLEGVILDEGFDTWWQKVGSDLALLRASQELLQTHAAETSDSATAIKAEYFVSRDIDPFEASSNAPSSNAPLDRQYRRLAMIIPWEKERQRRVFRALTLAALQQVHTPNPYLAFGTTYSVGDLFTNAAYHDGLPPRPGSGSELSAYEWGAFVLQCWPMKQTNYEIIQQLTFKRAANQQAAQAALAVRRYQAEHGKLPLTLEEIVPKYLISLTMQTGMPALYSFEETEGVVAPIFASNLVSMGIPAGMASLHFASALVAMSERVPVVRDMSMGTPSWVMGAGFAESPEAMIGGGAPPGLPLKQPLVPIAIISVGPYIRIVPANRKR